MQRGIWTQQRTLASAVLFVVIATQLLAPLNALAQFSYGLDPVDTGVYGSGVNLGFGNAGTGGGSVPISTNPDDYSIGTPVTGNGSGGTISVDPGDPNAYTVAPQEPNPSTKVTEAYVESTIASWIHNLAIMIGGWVAGMGGNAFEYAFDLAVVKLGCQFVQGGSGCSSASINTDGAIGAVVNELWKIIRDVFNVIFIFGLIFLGLKTILQSDDSSTRKAISNLLIAALLVNFSLYFAKLLVDVSNFTAVQIYHQMSMNIDCEKAGECYSIADGAGAFSLGAGNKVAGAFMEVLRVASWFNTTMQGGIVSQIGFAIMAMIFLIIVGAIFLYGAFMMLSRFIAIVILLIFSPAMFLGYVLPGFKSYSDKWRKMFVSYCFFAPAYVFMLYLSLYSLIQIGGAFAASASYGDAFNNGGQVTADSMGIFVFFFVGVGFLLASTKVAASMSAAGGGFIMQTGEKWARKVALGGSAYVGGYVPRYLTNKAGDKVESGIDNLQSRKGLVGGLARLRGVDTIARGTSTRLKNAQIGTGSTNEKEAKHRREIDDRAKKNRDQATAVTTLGDVTAGNQVARERAIAKLSPNDVVAMAKTDSGRAALVKNAHLLRPDQIKALKEDKEIKGSDRKEILDARSSKIEAKLTSADKIKDLSEDELSTLSFEKLTATADYVVHLSEAKIDKMSQFTSSEKDQIKNVRKAGMISIAGGTPVGGYTFDKLVRNKPEDLAKLPSDVFRIANFSKNLPANAVKSRYFADLDNSTQAEIRTHLEDIINNPPATLSQADLDRIADIDGWLRSPAGMSFGK